MTLKRAVIIMICSMTLISHGQNVINDCGSRLSFSVEKKINKSFSVFGKVQGRLEENFRLFNRMYFRLGLDYNLNDHFRLNVSGNYMRSRGGFKEMNNAYRYSAALTYKTKLTDRFSISNKVMYQISSDYLTNSELVKQKCNGVLRNKTTLKYKLNRRGDVFVSEELLWQLVGKKEKYFGRNRIYVGYTYKINAKLDIEPSFIFERTFNKRNGPQSRTFFYNIHLGYSF